MNATTQTRSAEDATLRTQPSDFFTFDQEQLSAVPFPHVLSTNFLKPEVYRALAQQFPGDEHFKEDAHAGRTGRDFYSPDSGFAEFLKGAPAWREFHSFIDSAAFVRFVVELMRPHLKSHGCRLDPDKARHVQFDEQRDALNKPLWSRAWDKLRARLNMDKELINDLYVRFDFEQGPLNYGKRVHCDLPNRLISLVLYFCDADELEMDGGDLGLHKHIDDKPPHKHERYPQPEDAPTVATVRPKDNTGVLFLCSNNSYHSVSPIRSSKGYRKFIYLNISSRAHRLW